MTASFHDAVRSLGPGASLALDALNAAASLRATSPAAGEAEDGLAPYDSHADELIVSASTLLVFATPETSRPAAAALRIATDGVDRDHAGWSSAISTVLNRVTLAITTIALSHSTPGALISLAGIEVAGEPLLSSNMLRYGRLHDGDAQITYEAAVAWLMGRPWRSEIAALARDDDLSVGVAEADLLLACLAAHHGNDPHSGGLSVHSKEASRRLAGRFRDPHQASGLAALLDVSIDDARETLTSAYGGVAAICPDGFPARKPALFGGG